ncbi:MAG: CaiB/BaiF CoA transferase family protein [Caulobacterales bacterium]|jgi:crotonobetainyl-CoA:carnitine CoA-transferase CaiB-like acyl-CoA transferase
MSGLLAGVKILAVEQYGAGPYGTMLLADLGAEIIKIEAPSMGGDVSRATGPYFLGANDSQFFQTFSKGKHSAALELKTPGGRAAFDDMVRGADAVVNNLRGDQPAKLKLTYADLAVCNRKIVCAHLSAYGRDNDRAAWPGYDYLMQAEAGFLSLTGEPDGPPVRCGLSIVDFHTGSQFALAILAGVFAAKRTGKGCDVDVSLFDTALHQLSYPATWYLNEGVRTGRLTRGAHPSIAPSQLVRTQDGWLMLMCQTPKFWESFCTRIGRPDLAADARFAATDARFANREALTFALDSHLVQQPTNHWLQVLGGHVPVAPVYDIAEALDSDYVQANGMIETVDHPDSRGGKLRTLASPIKVNGARLKSRRAPKLGEM